MPIYENPPQEVVDLVTEVLNEHHPALRDCAATIDVLFALAKTDKNGDIPEGAHALKLHGYPCAAVVKVNAYKLRVQGHADAEIVIDGDNWDTYSPEEQRAILDHELEHLETVSDKDGGLVRDDLGRPKLKIRLHDHQYGWFNSIVRRHGPHALEAQQARKFVNDHYTQSWLGFIDAPEPRVSDSRRAE